MSLFERREDAVEAKEWFAKNRMNTLSCDAFERKELMKLTRELYKIGATRVMVQNDLGDHLMADIIVEWADPEIGLKILELIIRKYSTMLDAEMEKTNRAILLSWD